MHYIPADLFPSRKLKVKAVFNFLDTTEGMLQYAHRAPHGRLGSILDPGGSDGKEAACSAGDPGSILDQEDPLEKATYSSILVWKIPRTEEPGQLLSMGSQRVGHD